ncbi:MAG: hypothetical protein HOW73_20395 [Polyangiaceae bacterium]|nr:hypothetical protein [Polyangiaceae bacterium]
MKLELEHPAQPSRLDENVAFYLSRDDGGLGSGACSMLANDATTENYDALGKIIRAGLQALGESRSKDLVTAMARRRRR